MVNEKVNSVIKHRWIWLAAITVVGFLIDIGTKHLALTRLEMYQPVNVIGEYLQWLLIYNKGAVFGLNPSNVLPWLPSNVFFIVCMCAAIAFLLIYFWRLRKDEVLTHIGLMLVLPGALGNLYDRVFRGDDGVVDFIRMGIPPDTYWFIYNVADIYVTLGVAVMIVGFIVDIKNASKQNSQEKNKIVGDDKLTEEQVYSELFSDSQFYNNDVGDSQVDSNENSESQVYTNDVGDSQVNNNDVAENQVYDDDVDVLDDVDLPDDVDIVENESAEESEDASR